MAAQQSRGWEIPALLVGGGFSCKLGLLWLATYVAALVFGGGWPALGADDAVRSAAMKPQERKLLAQRSSSALLQQSSAARRRCSTPPKERST
jgi:hypothetical protein